MFDTFSLDVPTLRDEPGERLSDLHLMIMEAVTILTAGVETAIADQEAVTAFVAQHWSRRASSRETRHLMKLGLAVVTLAQVEPWNKRLARPRFWQRSAIQLTPEGRLEHFAQRGRVFR